jgi:predicted RNase H-like nuclease (RuvC/YqgF family)
MEAIATDKKLKMIKCYFEGMSYKEIANKCGVSTGSVSNVINDLKAGEISQVSTIPEEIGILKELSSNLKHSDISPIEACIGFSVIDKLNAIGLEPAEIEKCHTLLKVMAPPGIDLGQMAESILKVEALVNATGLTIPDLENKVCSLKAEKEVLAPVVEELKATQQQLLILKQEKENLVNKNQELNKQKSDLDKTVESLKKEEIKLLKDATEIEDRAHAADKKLTGARNDMDTLEKIGMSQQYLSQFTVKVKDIAAYHSIKPEDLGDYLLKELKTIGKVLTLDSEIKSKKAQLKEIDKEISQKQDEKSGIKQALDQMKTEKTKVESEIAYRQKQLTKNINSQSDAAINAIQTASDTLHTELAQGLSEIDKLKDRALTLGKEVGVMEAELQALGWIKPLMSLMDGSANIDKSQFRVISLRIFRVISLWLNGNSYNIPNVGKIKAYINGAIEEIEKCYE